MPIRRSPNGAHHPVHSLVAIARNGWSRSPGARSRDTRSVLPVLEKLENSSWRASVEGGSRSNASPRWVVNAEVHRDFALRAQEVAQSVRPSRGVFSSLRRPTPRSTTTGGSTP